MLDMNYQAYFLLIIVCCNSLLLIDCKTHTHYSDPFCGKPCKQAEDCKSAKNCNICTSRSFRGPPYNCSNNEKSNEKICMSQYMKGCGGPPTPPQSKSLPQYLVIGDSIACGYFPALKNRLKNIAEVRINTGAPNTSGDGVKCIDVWIGDDLQRWDVITFNFGANDIAQSQLLDYLVNIKNITLSLVKTKAAKKGKLIFVTTTPTSNGTVCCDQSQFDALTTKVSTPVVGVCYEILDAYNDGASKIMMQFRTLADITVDNLCHWVNHYCCFHDDCTYDNCTSLQPVSSSHCQIEFTYPNGWDFLAVNVTSIVKEVLKKPRKSLVKSFD